MNHLTADTLSLKKLLQALILVVVCAFIAGIAGVLTTFLMFWMTRQNFAIDSEDKHGISHQQASRLGGVAVAFCALCIYWLSVGLNLPSDRVGEAVLSTPITYAVLIGFIGFCDDAHGHIPARLRILLTALIFAAFLIINPDYMPRSIGLPIVDSMLNFWPVAFSLCVFGCLGVLNATNMADGANGLMPLVFMGSFFGLFLVSGELVYFALTMGLMVFTLFNVLSGKLFLGDTGSYGLGALAALGVLKIISSTDAEVWFFLCLAAYPVIDFFVSVIRRILAGRSPLSADSDHMHNRLYRYLRFFLPSPLVANSVSGLTISLGTTGASVVLLNYWDISSVNWIILFFTLALIYLVFFALLSVNDASHE